MSNIPTNPGNPGGEKMPDSPMSATTSSPSETSSSSMQETSPTEDSPEAIAAESDDKPTEIITGSASIVDTSIAEQSNMREFSTPPVLLESQNDQKSISVTNRPLHKVRSGTSHADRHFTVYRQIRRISKERIREKEIKQILKRFFNNYQNASLIASQNMAQTLQALTSPGRPIPVIQAGQPMDYLLPPSVLDQTSTSETSTTKCLEDQLLQAVYGSPPKASGEQFHRDRLNTLTDMLEEIEGLKELLDKDKFFADSVTDPVPGPSSRPTAAELDPQVREIYNDLLSNLINLRVWTRRLLDFCMTPSGTFEELQICIDGIDSIRAATSGFLTVKERLKVWNYGNNSITELGDTTCLLELENRISTLLQTLIVESHYVNYKYWIDKTDKTPEDKQM